MSSEPEGPQDRPDERPDEQLSPLRRQVFDVLRSTLAEADLEFTEVPPKSLMVTLPGERKQQTPCRFDVGGHALEVHAFVCRQPDENHEAVYRWMLERNMKMYALGFALDGVGDIYLEAKLPLEAVTPPEVDRLLGAVLEYADGSFNTLLELGFATSIRKEWDWRVSRGESTRNLEAFIGPLGLDRPSADRPSSERPSDD